MAVRNFWTRLRVDGRTTEVSTGPRNARGGFTQVIYMREDGTPKVALRITAEAFPDGELRLFVEPGGDYRDGDDRVTAIEPYTSNSPNGFVIKVKR